LGNGASITAVANGESRDTSMGLTPLEGLVMGTRSGDIDPAVFGFLAENANMTITQITDMLNKKSGLLGLSGLSNDCRTIEEESGKGHPGAKLALDVFIYRLAKYIGSMAVAAGGLDVLVFTGGIGENSDIIRERVLGYLGFLGLKADHEANLKARFGNAGVITTADSAAVAVVIPTNEELMIAHDTARLSGL
jgi:acetate kinase